MNKEPKEPKFPENITFKKTLVTGDYGEIAIITGHSIRHIQEVFNGRSRMNDKIKVAYVAVLTKREKLNSEVIKKAKRKDPLKSEVTRQVKRIDYQVEQLTVDSPEHCRNCKGGPECSCGEGFCPYF